MKLISINRKFNKYILQIKVLCCNLIPISIILMIILKIMIIMNVLVN